MKRIIKLFLAFMLFLFGSGDSVASTTHTQKSIESQKEVFDELIKGVDPKYVDELGGETESQKREPT